MAAEDEGLRLAGTQPQTEFVCIVPIIGRDADLTHVTALLANTVGSLQCNLKIVTVRCGLLT